MDCSGQTSAMHFSGEQNVCQERPDSFREANQRAVFSIVFTQKGKLDIHSFYGSKVEFSSPFRSWRTGCERRKLSHIET